MAVQFLDGLLAKQVQGNCKPSNYWACSPTISVTTCAALAHAVRFGAFALTSIRRILAAQARPKALLDELSDPEAAPLDPCLREDPVGPRPTSDYQHLLVQENPSDETPTEPPSPKAVPEEPPAEKATSDPGDEPA